VNEARQTQDAALAWADVQQKMWEYSIRGVEAVVRPQYLEAWQRSANTMIDAWANSVKLGLQAQRDLAGFWTRRVSDNERAPKEVVEWAHQSYDVAKAWNQAQQDLWDVWFVGMRNLGPMTYTGAILEVSKAWQDAARKTLDAQAEVTRKTAEQGARAAASSPEQGARAAATTADLGARAASNTAQQAERAASRAGG
jgi:hypothetical protein